jgi:hypothetical protein
LTPGCSGFFSPGLFFMLSEITPLSMRAIAKARNEFLSSAVISQKCDP